jgi:hypothetical protein
MLVHTLGYSSHTSQRLLEFLDRVEGADARRRRSQLMPLSCRLAPAFAGAIPCRYGPIEAP